MLRWHTPLRSGVDRWARAVARSLSPSTRVAVRDFRNRFGTQRLVTTADEPGPVAVDVWAEADELADSMMRVLAAEGIDAGRAWLSGPAILIEADQSSTAIEALKNAPNAGSWWVLGPRRRFQPLADAPTAATGRWQVRLDRRGASEEGLTGQGVSVVLQFVGHEDFALDHLPLRVTTRPHALHMTEPIDVVYTWVDDRDPLWRAQRASISPDSEVSLDALSPSRTVDHGELRYSLRSLAGFANWVRHIWIVTSGQVPPWLNVEHPKVTVVSHRQIFTDPSALPTFNSHAIESQLHHIDGLAEHFLYLNDDVFFGRPVAPELFFHGNGIAKFMASDLTIDRDPDDSQRNGAAAAARRNRDLIEQLWNRTTTHRMKHVPHAHRRSSLFDLEARLPDEFAAVARSRFRSPDDVSVASDLGHYHAYALGLAAPGSVNFRYVDLASQNLAQFLNDLLARQAFDVFCLNDAQSDHSRNVSSAVVDFLQSYFPAPSPFERDS